MPSLRRGRVRRPALRLSKVDSYHESANLSIEPLEDRHLLTLIGIVPEFPQIQYDSGGITNYTAATQALDITATPLTFQESAGDPFRGISNTPFPSFEIHIRVDNAGNLIGGMPGDDFRLYGDIDIDGDTLIDVSGTLLTGEILQFGYQEAGPSVDFFDFRFKVTGGALTEGPYASYFAGKDIGISQRLEARVGFPSFNDSFATDFAPNAKGVVGPVDALIPAIEIVKTALSGPACQGDIDGTGVVVIAHPGDNVTYQYSITNPGDWPLELTTLIDDNGTPGDLGDDIDILTSGVFVSGDTNMDGLVDPGETWIYEFTKPLTDLGFTTNIVEVVGTPVDPNGDPIDALGTVTASDDARVFVAEAAISLEKRVNSKDANVEPPEFDHVLLGSAVNFTYLVTNNGNIALDLSDIVDDNATPGNGDDFIAVPVLKPNLNNLGDANDNGRFDPGETWEFEALGVIADTLGLRTNIATVTGTPIDFFGVPIDPNCLEPVDDSDPANIYVDLPAILLEKSVVDTGQCEADVNGTGVVAVYHPGDMATFRYTLTNPGTVALQITSLIDDNGTPGDLGDDVNILTAGTFISGDTDTDGFLDIDETWVYEFSKQVTALGVYTNIAVVVGQPVGNGNQPLTNLGTVTDTDDAELFVAEVGINLEKRVNGKDANSAPPAFDRVLQGSGVNYTYLVTNTGNVILSLSNFVDDNGTPANLADDFIPTPVLQGGFNIGDANQNNQFDSGETWEFEALGILVSTLGLHTNTASVTGLPVDVTGNRIACLDPVVDTDPANIIVDFPAIELTKIVLDPDCTGDPDGQGVVPIYNPNASVTYQYTLVNSGTTALLVNLTDVADNGTPLNLVDDISTNLIDNGIAQAGVTISGDLDGDNLLDTDETWVVTFDAIVSTLGHNRNLASVVGTPVEQNGLPITSLSNVADVDDANVYVASVGMNIEKRVNSKDANTEPPAFDHVAQGAAVNYSYIITNTGNVALSLSNFVDDNGTPANLGDDFTPTPVLQGGFNIGDANQNNIFDAGETWEFEQLGVVLTTAGLHTNLATVTGTPIQFNGNVFPCLTPVTDSDPANIIVDPPVVIPLLSSLAGFVYQDCNNNGIYEPGSEFPIADVTVQLYQNNVLIASTTTDIFGRYQFTNLPAGTYEIREVQPGGFLDGKEGIGAPGAPPANFVVETMNMISDRFTDIVLPAGVDGASYNFGELKPSSVAGCVYIDVNNNGVRDPNETPIAGVDITITGIDDRGNVVNTTISTDLDGLYKFQNLRPANNVGYTLTQTHPALFLDGKDKVGTAGGVAGAQQPDADTITGIVLGGCTDATGYCFGERGYIVPSKRPFIFTNGAWQNQSNALDVNADGRITGQDVLIVVDALTRLGIGTLPQGNGTTNFPDVNGDQVLSPADVLQIVNQLNVQARTVTSSSTSSTAQGLLSDVAFSEMTSESDSAADIAASLATPSNTSSKSSASSSSTNNAGSSSSGQSSKNSSQGAQYSDAELIDIALGLASEYEDSSSEEGLYDLVGAAF